MSKSERVEYNKCLEIARAKCAETSRKYKEEKTASWERWIALAADKKRKES